MWKGEWKGQLLVLGLPMVLGILGILVALVLVSHGCVTLGGPKAP